MQLPQLIRNSLLSFVLIPASLQQAHAFQYTADTVKKDTVPFQYADAKFDSTDETAFFRSVYGYLISYPKGWERDKRTADNLILYLRPYDEKYPSTFREMLTVIREPIEDTSKTLSEYVTMQNKISENTWAKYNLDYAVESSEKFVLNGIDSYEIKSSLKKVSQEKLLVMFIQNNYVYKIEYTATNITYKDFLKTVRKVINSFAFVE